MLFIVKSSTDFSAIVSPFFKGSPPSHISAMETEAIIRTAIASSMTYFFIGLLRKLILWLVMGRRNESTLYTKLFISQIHFRDRIMIYLSWFQWVCFSVSE